MQAIAVMRSTVQVAAMIGPGGLLGRRLAGGVLLSVAAHAAVIGLVIAASPTLSPRAVPFALVVVTPEVPAPAPAPDPRRAERTPIAHAPRRMAPPLATQAAERTQPPSRPEHAEPSSLPVEKRETAAPSVSPGASNDSPGAWMAPAPQGTASGRSDPAPGSGETHAAVPAASTERTGFSAPRLQHEGKLGYPAAARAAGIEGTVIVKVHVLANGKVATAEIVRSAGHPLLDQAAVDSIRAAQFIPARRGDAAVPVWVEVPVQFKLKR